LFEKSGKSVIDALLFIVSDMDHPMMFHITAKAITGTTISMLASMCFICFGFIFPLKVSDVIE
jgi:hypothetical protein